MREYPYNFSKIVAKKIEDFTEINLIFGRTSMNRRTLLISVATLGILASSAAWSRSAAIQTITSPIFSTSEVTLEKVRTAIIRGGLAKNWQVVGENGQKLTLKYVKKVHVAACDVTYDTKSYTITINPMTTLIQGPNEVHPKYNQWVRNLDKQIQLQLTK